ncbi:MAG: FAD-dependent oxidoreductase [candidate division Zixibacteria bacterium]|nr:FAD-dependent oxidoreductase [candidate division Zixibacteria bacterium]
MPTHTVKLLRSEEIAHNTKAFYFEKPDGFDFQAGQCVDVTLIDPPETDMDGNLRALTIASAPYEKELMLATRRRDKAFKRVLFGMAPGDGIQITGPHGSFVLHEDASVPAVFIAGGMGITPVLSILRQAVKEGLKHRLTLFYSNRRPEDAAFLAELVKLEKKCDKFKLIATMTQPGESSAGWSGLTGRIDREMLMSSIKDIAKPVYYVVGSLDMVYSTNATLMDMGVSEENIEYEEFPGY